VGASVAGMEVRFSCRWPLALVRWPLAFRAAEVEREQTISRNL